CSSWRSLRPAAQQSFIRTTRINRNTAVPVFTSATQPDAGFASCYKKWWTPEPVTDTTTKTVTTCLNQPF
ncbi:hypothetical protein AB4Z35_20875, partial [Pseudomonas sp. KB_15]|uniref:hypothetical protein n=1 Tax=Pseudomonas sp. KB_15 TaxID=3233035 RepID=UPI003F95AD4C